jgi:UbiD family decarboxylase
MAFKDLRAYLERLDEIGELQRIPGAHWDLEMGVLGELAFEQHGPALLFQEVPDYPPEYGVVTNLCSTERRVQAAFGLDPDAPLGEGVAWLKAKMDSFQPVPPTVVGDGPVLEHVKTGDDIDLLEFPVPVWHELDGGRFIGTGDCFIVRDPETGAINVGTYRMQVHDRNTTGLWQALSTDGRRALRKYWEKGESAPVAVTFGQEPVLFLASCGHLGVPRGVPELEFAGHVRGEPVEVVLGKLTGLPIPANAEIAIEGELPPPQAEMRDEGPFGEYTGYYAGGVAPEPVVHVKALYHRTNPIMVGAPPMKPVAGAYCSPMPSGMLTSLWTKLDQMVTGVLRVQDIASVGAIVVQLRQENKDTVPRVVDALTELPINWRMFVLVDEDIDVEDAKDVVWAIGSRCDPATGVSINTIQSTWGLNPHLPVDYRKKMRSIEAANSGYAFSRMIINACRPYAMRDQLGPVNQFSHERRAEARQKWGHLLQL